MSFYAPLPSETFYDPVGLLNAPLVHDFPPEMPTTLYDYNASFDCDPCLQEQFMRSEFCIDAFQTLGEPGTDVHHLVDQFSAMSSTSMPEVDPACMSTSVLSDQLDAWIDEHYSSSASMSAGFPASSTGNQQSHIGYPPSDAHARHPRQFQRNTDAEYYERDVGTSSECSEYSPHRPAKRPVAARKVGPRPLADSLQPIRVSSAKFASCPLPDCGMEIEAKDSAWRGHFKRVHHDELCLTRGCRGLVTGTCVARCPLVDDSCTGDHGRKHTHTHGAGAMTLESVGRHVLNVHIKVVYRCPLCGLENEWRESACVRHIRRCAEKHGKQMSC